jgi:multiple sugar transport system substrate-binding protein
MCFMGPWNIANILSENPKLNYGIVEPPKGSVGKASFAGGSNLAIMKGSKNKAGAKAFVKFMISDPVLLDWSLNISKFLPATQSANTDPRLSQGNWKVFKDTISYATAYPTLGVWADIETAIQNNFKAAIADYVNGKYKAEGAKAYLDTAAGQINAALAKEK